MPRRLPWANPAAQLHRRRRGRRTARPPRAIRGCGRCKTDLLFPNISDHGPVLNRSHHVRRVVGGSVVDNDDLVVRPREFLTYNACNRLCEKIGPISRTNDYGNEPLARGHDVAPLPRIPDRTPFAARNLRQRLLIVRDAFRGCNTASPGSERLGCGQAYRSRGSFGFLLREGT